MKMGFEILVATVGLLMLGGSAFVVPSSGSLQPGQSGALAGEGGTRSSWEFASAPAPLGTTTAGFSGVATLLASIALFARAYGMSKCGQKSSMQSEQRMVACRVSHDVEIESGRMVMLAAMHGNSENGLAGSMLADSVDDNKLLHLRAFESELGVQPPLGYWDPCGLSKDGNMGNYIRRRTVELKHGRVCMFATLGYMVPEYYHWPGYCSPSAKLAFADIPNGLAAISKISGSGWAQMIIFVGFVETGYYQSDPNRPPGDYANGGVLGVPNGSTLPGGEEKQRRLSAEIANGRLAMAALMGMFFQDGLTGSAWGSWSKFADGVLR